MTEKDKKIKELLKGNFDAPAPSPDFTDHIMKKVVAQEAVKEQRKFEYTPVISKRGWIFIGAIFFVLVYLGLTGEKGVQLTVPNYVSELHFDAALMHSPLALFAVLSIFTLLIIDRVLIRFR